jgi:hypothetical protein
MTITQELSEKMVFEKIEERLPEKFIFSFFCVFASLRLCERYLILKIEEEADALRGCALIVELSPFFHAGPVRVSKTGSPQEIVPSAYADLITLRGTEIHLAAEFQIECAVQFQRSEQRKISSVRTKLKKKLSIFPGIDEE